MNKKENEATILFNKLKEIVGVDSDYKLAKLLDISPQALSKQKVRNTPMYNRIIDYLESAHPEVDHNVLFKSTNNLEYLSQTDDILTFEFNPIEVGAGDPVDLNFEIYYNFIPVPEGLNEPGVVTVRIVGDSMKGTLDHGTIVLVDTRVKNIVSGDIYCLDMPHEGLIIKRLFKVPEHVRVRSDNNIYPEFSLSYEEVDKYLFGKAEWRAGKI